MPAHSIVLGDVQITRVIEWSGPIRTARFIIPDSDEQVWRRNQDWLAPHFWTPADDAYRCHIQTWVLRSEGKTILVDTGVGNDRQRPQRDGEWVPTFPNATYLIPRPDNLYFDPDTAHRRRAPRDEHERVRWEGSKLVFNDIQRQHRPHPPGRTGGAVGGHPPHGRQPAAGGRPRSHPGSSVLTLRSGTDRAVFVGDMLHSPVAGSASRCQMSAL
ncbi:hypothetical protein ACU635_35150 [[Actinomadura] parvosata]|uniref:hypothetical protein n=1 Tax=[Actinomadura] parvosata TaxID=1955412 RepID=UPI00406D49A7